MIAEQLRKIGVDRKADLHRRRHAERADAVERLGQVDLRGGALRQSAES